MNFDAAFEKLIGHEGGYSNNPADLGGETMFGITLRVARANGYVGAMRDLPLDTAKDIARRAYWDAVQADTLPDALRFDVFDGAYNSGPGQSIRWLQRAVYATPDGVIGGNTLMGLQTYNPLAVCARYNGHRLDFMNDLGTWANFGRGWSQRIAENLIATKG
jgi:lysozyme family protein